MYTKERERDHVNILNNYNYILASGVGGVGGGHIVTKSLQPVVPLLLTVRHEVKLEFSRSAQYEDVVRLPLSCNTGEVRHVEGV